jgi:hypothetical protein
MPPVLSCKPDNAEPTPLITLALACAKTLTLVKSHLDGTPMPPRVTIATLAATPSPLQGFDRDRRIKICTFRQRQIGAPRRG